MTSNSNDHFYEDNELTEEFETVYDDYAGPRKIQPEHYMESRITLRGHTPWIPLRYQVDPDTKLPKAA
ncbi:hypothetical protein [Rhizobium sp. FKY42]|uniref:hypothetical protein n=1 Tax=Rhizobium sp. FKY42 TaxID=2562310 RepID=UPI0010BF85A1|nr:hypothetical protein [Rhizobium sp. FKY42]